MIIESYNIDQNVSVKHEQFLKIVVSATPDLHVMELSHPLPIMLGKVAVSPLGQDLVHYWHHNDLSEISKYIGRPL
jgi:hypothetical protein